MREHPDARRDRRGTDGGHGPGARHGAGRTPLPRFDPALLRPSADAFRLGPGDKLQIEVIGDANSSTSVTVGPDGKIYYYILPGIDVWGLTLAEARERLAGGLQHFMREKPIVAVTLRSTASQRVWVLGQVNTPGVFTLAGPTTLLEAVAEGGGLAAAAPGMTPEGPSEVGRPHARLRHPPGKDAAE